MANGYTINDTNYAGEAAAGFIVKTISEAETVKNGHVHVKDNIVKKFTIPRFSADYTNLIQDREAMPSTKGEFTVDGKELNPNDYMIFTTFNPRDFEDHWQATQMNGKLLDRKLPTTVESVMIQEVLKQHSKFFNKILWNGKETNTDIMKYTDGFIKVAVDDSDVVDVSSPTTLSAGNIEAELEKGYALIPEDVKHSGTLKIFMGYAAYDFYVSAQIAQTYKGNDFTQAGVASYKGIPVVKISDFPANTYMIANGNRGMDSNLWVGMNSIQDASIELAKYRPEGELYYIKMLCSVDTQIGWGQEVVLYGTI